MWFRAEARLPFYGDPDYQASLVTSIKHALGPIPVDVTLFPSFGIFEVNIEPEQVEVLTELALVGTVCHAIDREMLAGPRHVV